MKEVRCGHVDDAIERLLAGAVPLEDEEDLRRHADGCASCAAMLDWMDGLRDGPPIPPEPDDLTRRRGFLALETRLRQAPPRLGWQAFAAAAAAGAVALVVGLALGGQTPSRVARIASVEATPAALRWSAPPGGSAKYDLGGGTELSLSEGASARVVGLDGPTLEIQLASGLLVGELSHRGGAVKRIVVTAPRGRVEVTGTVFAVRSTRDADIVAVDEGVVQVVSDRRRAQVAAGQARSLESLALVDSAPLAPVWRLLRGIDVDPSLAAAPTAPAATLTDPTPSPHVSVARAAPAAQRSAAQLLDDASTARQAGRYPEAIRLFEDVLARGPTRSERERALLFMAEAQVQDGRLRDAAVTWERLAEVAAGSPNGARALLELGDTRRSLGDRRAADRAFSRYLASSSSPPAAQEAYRRRMDLAEEDGRADDARRLATEYVARYPGGPYTALARRILDRPSQ